MNQKPEIQYVGQFYVYGSEAREAALKEQKEKHRLPRPKLVKLQKIYIDPVAVVGIATAVILMICMAVGAVQLNRTWKEYNRAEAYLSNVKRQNAMVEHAYRTSYDLERIQSAAESMGMIPAEEAKTMTVHVTLPQPKAERTALDNLKWFLRGLVD